MDIPERFALFFAFTLIGSLAGKSMACGLLMGMIGLLLGVIGTDDINGVDRFAFGTPYLRDGIGLLPLDMGLLGLGMEIPVRRGNGLRNPPEHLGRSFHDLPVFPDQVTLFQDGNGIFRKTGIHPDSTIVSHLGKHSLGKQIIKSRPIKNSL